MVISILRVVLFIGHANSLKAKRMVLNSLKTRLRNKFNIAISEIDEHDKWQKSTLGIVSIGKDRRYMDKQFSNIINYIEIFNQVDIVNYERQMI